MTEIMKRKRKQQIEKRRAQGLEQQREDQSEGKVENKVEIGAKRSVCLTVP
jgi:hypothetical protein